MKENLYISNQATISQVEGNIVSDMDGEKVMLSIEKGKYFNLGELGGEIWRKIESPIQLETLITHLLEQYEVEQDVCELEVKGFINQLAEQGLVEINVSSALR